MQMHAQAAQWRIAPHAPLLPAGTVLPGHPQRPALLHHTAVARRSPATHEGRIILMHAIAHIEVNASNLALDAIWFNADLALWPLPDNAHVQVAYRLDVNEFRGQQNLQLMVEWLAPAVVAAGSMVQPVYG